tara:strand:+ start:3525 stop:3908 length:384 start_codon:yes stop_codon:yes gene_type:complete
MAHYAKVSAGKVTQVIVADQDFIDSIKVDNEPGEWVQTSYNTYGGVHYDRSTNPPTPSKDQSKALRKNYAGVNFHYNKKVDAFYDEQPYPSWTLNETTYLWESPVAYPNDGKQYKWNETNKSWEEIT